MTKTKQHRDKHHRGVKHPAPPVDGLTVGWMVTLSTALLCELAAIGTRAYVRYVAPDAKLLGILSGLLLFSAAIIGVVLLVMTPAIVYRKRSSPPRGLVVFAYVVGAAPWIAMLVQGLE